jgi:hypothetical protein
MVKKFLIALQYWDGDKDRVVELLDIYHKTIQPQNPWADLCLYARFDSSFLDEDVLNKMRQIFNKVWTFKSRTPMTGWPDGCNALWGDLVMDAWRKSIETSTSKPPIWQEYKSVFAIESDTCPLHEDWLAIISKEWDESECSFMGAWDHRNPDYPHLQDLGHINGNAMFSMDLARKAPNVVASPLGQGWDTYHAPILREIGWQGTNKIRNWYHKTQITKKEYDSVKDSGAVFIHGVKDDSVRTLYLKQYE